MPHFGIAWQFCGSAINSLLDSFKFETSTFPPKRSLSIQSQTSIVLFDQFVNSFGIDCCSSEEIVQGDKFIGLVHGVN